jgi:hypothetical protein
MDDYYGASAVQVTITVTQATPTVSVSDDGGTVNGSPFPATATVAGVIPGVDDTPTASLEGVGLTLTYYAGSTASGDPLAGAPTDPGTYTVVANFPGSRDYVSASASATFTIHHLPTAADIGPVTARDQPVTVDVLAHASDPDGDPLTVLAVTQGNYGSVTINEDDTVTYTPNSGVVGDDVFTYTVDNGHDGTATATVYVSIYGSGQWASSVVSYSSQRSGTDGSAAQALGAPDTGTSGDNVTAWSPSSQDGTTETLTLGFGSLVYATGFTIRETSGNGFVTRVDLIDEDGTAHTVWSGTDTTPADGPRDFTVNFAPTDYRTQQIRIYVDTDLTQDVWEEIDAVQLSGGVFKAE